MTDLLSVFLEGLLSAANKDKEERRKRRLFMDFVPVVFNQIAQRYPSLPFDGDEFSQIFSKKHFNTSYIDRSDSENTALSGKVLSWAQALYTDNSLKLSLESEQQEIAYWICELDKTRLPERGVVYPVIFEPLTLMLYPLLSMESLLTVLSRLNKGMVIPATDFVCRMGLANIDYWSEQAWCARHDSSRCSSNIFSLISRDIHSLGRDKIHSLIGHYVETQLNDGGNIKNLFTNGHQWLQDSTAMEPIHHISGLMGKLVLGMAHSDMEITASPKHDDSDSWCCIYQSVEQKTFPIKHILSLLKSLGYQRDQQKELIRTVIKNYPIVIETALEGTVDLDCLRGIKDQETLIRLMPSKGEHVQRFAIKNLNIDWSMHTDFLEAYPDAIAKYASLNSTGLVLILWERVSKDAAYQRLMTTLIKGALYAETAEQVDVDKRAIKCLWEACRLICNRVFEPIFQERETLFSLPVWEFIDSSVRKQVLKNRLNDDYSDDSSYEKKYENLDYLIFRDFSFQDVEPFLEGHSKKQASRKYLVPALARQQATYFDGSWFKHKQKDVRTLGLEALLENNNEGTAQVLLTWFNEKLDATAQGLILDKLESLGQPIESIDPLVALSPENLDQYSNRILNKRALDKFTPFITAEMEAVALPLTKNTLVALCYLSAIEDWKPTPRQCVQAFSLLSTERRARFAELMLNAWLEKDGDRKLRWTLKFATAFGDDRLIEPLAKAIKDWQKGASAKAVVALSVMASMDTASALSQVETYTSNKGNTWAMQNTATFELRQAAKRRGVSLKEMYDLLIPDFGMGPEGLILDVGPYAYTVKLANDLNLIVTHSETGKNTKSLPKAKADEDTEKREACEGKFKILKKNIKNVAKQQAVRMDDALVSSKRWQPDSWRSLFVDHPVLSVMAQGLIWIALDASDGNMGSFRISEDKSLITADDEIFDLDAFSILLWHPVDAKEGEQEQWHQHMEDYEIKPFIEQASKAVFRLSEEELEGKELSQFSSKEFMWGDFKRRMTQWGFDVSDQDGSHIFGYDKRYPSARIQVNIDCEDARITSTFDESMKIGTVSFSIGGKHQVQLKRVPSRILSSIISDLSLIKPYV